MSEKHCKFCKSILFDDDDVVVCPECGAPHHRECYNQLGHCAAEAEHGKLQDDLIDEVADEVSTECESGHHDRECADGGHEQSEQPDGVQRDREGHACPKCGLMSTSDTLFCPYCGNRFEGDESEQQYHSGSPFGSPVRLDPLGGVDPKSKIDGIDADEVALYVRVNTSRYVPLFARMHHNGKRLNWNWAAFLFPQAWLFLRKCYFAGFVSSALGIISSLMCAPVLQQVANVLADAPISITSLEAAQLQQEAILNASPLFIVLYLGGMLLSGVIHIVVGMFGDKLYKNKVLDKLHSINNDDEIEDKKQEIYRVGGLNLWLALLAMMMYSFNIL